MMVFFPASPRFTVTAVVKSEATKIESQQRMRRGKDPWESCSSGDIVDIKIILLIINQAILLIILLNKLL